VGVTRGTRLTPQWKEVEGRIIEFIRSMGEAGNAGDADESASEENDDRFGDDEWEAEDPVSEDEDVSREENSRAVVKARGGSKRRAS
jgi:hypothetical protein